MERFKVTIKHNGLTIKAIIQGFSAMQVKEQLENSSFVEQYKIYCSQPEITEIKKI